jgi:FlaA1/EpsC-like NDP-sugar epimerase
MNVLEMQNLKQVFHIISYLQYPLMLGSLWFYIPFIKTVSKGSTEWAQLNYSLILFGIAVCFSTLQDTNKTSLKIEKYIWKNPTGGKIAIIVIAILIFSTLSIGAFGYFFESNKIIKEVSLGLIVLGIGFIGMLKTAIEVFENHRTDKQTTANRNYHP